MPLHSSQNVAATPFLGWYEMRHGQLSAGDTFTLGFFFSIIKPVVIQRTI